MRGQNGRPRRDRRRAMRFALWAQRVPIEILTPDVIAEVAGVRLSTARQWRVDLVDAIGPFAIDGIPPIKRPAVNGADTSNP